jgi:2-haloalkanoic acid dehalogenase type II
MKLSQFKVLTFDCYGTLIDWETGMTAALEPLVGRLRPRPSRDRILEAHARHESAQQRWTPAKRYSDLLATVHKRLAEEWGVEASWKEAQDYGRSIEDWPAFPDSAEALRYLKKHFKLAILSNVDNASFAFSNAKLETAFDAVYTAEDVGSYKPDRRNFEYMLEKLATLGIAKHEILHTAESLFHDHEPARKAGLATCWIHRRHAQGGFGATMQPKELPKPDFRFTSLAEMAEAHRRELAGAA